MPGVIACLGPEVYFHRLVAREAKAALKKRLQSDVEVMAFVVEEGWDPAQIVPYLATDALFGGGSIVKVWGLEEVEASVVHQLWQLGPPPGGSSVLLLSGDQLPKGASPAGGWRVACATPRREVLEEWLPWVGRMADDRHLRVTPEAQRRLVEGAETLGAIETELDKLALVTPPGGSVDVKMVEMYTANPIQVSRFELVPALIERRVDDALYVMRQVVEEPSDVTGLIGFLVSETNLLWESRLLMDRQIPEAQAAAQLGVKPGRWHYLQKRARSMTPARCRSWIEALMEADRRLKVGESAPDVEVEWLVFRLTSSVS